MSNSQQNFGSSSVSELRRDLVTGTWVVVATSRGRRPEFFASQKRQRDELRSQECPFCDIRAHQNILVYKKNNGDWSLRVFPNKYPAFSPLSRLNRHEHGPFEVVSGAGFHEVIATRDHTRQIASFSVLEIAEVLDAYQERYLALMNRRFVNYISIFHNHGKEAGASIPHPHSQLIALPVIDPDISRSLEGSERYWQSNRKCVHCVMLEWEKEDGERIIFENESFIVLCPFVSRTAFEVRVYPKKHLSYFERITNQEKFEAAEALKVALAKIFKGLDDPAYNFFLHTAPCDGKDYLHYHWHFEIFPKTSIWAGFELSTGIEISTIEPERAAEFLRGIKVSSR